MATDDKFEEVTPEEAVAAPKKSTRKPKDPRKLSKKETNKRAKEAAETFPTPVSGAAAPKMGESTTWAGPAPMTLESYGAAIDARVARRDAKDQFVETFPTGLRSTRTNVGKTGAVTSTEVTGVSGAPKGKKAEDGTLDFTVTGKMGDEKPPRSNADIRGAIMGGAQTGAGLSAIMAGGDAAGASQRRISDAIDEMEPYDFRDPAQAEAWSSGQNARIAAASAALNTARGNAHDAFGKPWDGSSGLPISEVLEAPKSEEDEEAHARGLKQAVGRNATQGQLREAAPKRERSLTPLTIKTFDAFKDFTHRKFLKTREYVARKATGTALDFSMRKIHDAGSCGDNSCVADRQNILNGAPNTQSSIGSTKQQQYKHLLGSFALHHSDDPAVQALVNNHIKQAHLKHGTRYNDDVGRTSQSPSESDWVETPSTLPGPDGTTVGNPEILNFEQQNSHIFNTLELTKHLNDALSHPVLGPALAGKFPGIEKSGGVTPRDVIRAVSASKNMDSAHPELLDDESAIFIPQSVTHQNAVQGLVRIARGSHRQLKMEGNALANIENSGKQVERINPQTGKKENVTAPWGPGEQEAAAEGTKRAAESAHMAWLGYADQLLGHAEGMRDLSTQNRREAMIKSVARRRGLAEPTLPGDLPEEGRSRITMRPGARTIANVDLSDRVRQGMSVAAASGTLVQDGSVPGYGGNPRDLIPSGEVGFDYMPGTGSRSTMPDFASRRTGTGNVESPEFDTGTLAKGDEAAEVTRNQQASSAARLAELQGIESSKQAALAPIHAKVEAHNERRTAVNQKPHTFEQALSTLGLAGKHAQIVQIHDAKTADAVARHRAEDDTSGASAGSGPRTSTGGVPAGGVVRTSPTGPSVLTPEQAEFERKQKESGFSVD